MKAETAVALFDAIDEALADPYASTLNLAVEQVCQSAAPGFDFKGNHYCEVENCYAFQRKDVLLYFVTCTEGGRTSGFNGAAFPDLYGEWVYQPLDSDPRRELYKLPPEVMDKLSGEATARLLSKVRADVAR